MRILLFIVLKVIEIGGMIFIPYFLGRLIVLHIFRDHGVVMGFSDRAITWVVGLFGVLVASFIVLFLYSVIPGWFKLNWNIINQIIK